MLELLAGALLLLVAWMLVAFMLREWARRYRTALVVLLLALISACGRSAPAVSPEGHGECKEMQIVGVDPRTGDVVKVDTVDVCFRLRPVNSDRNKRAHSST